MTACPFAYINGRSDWFKDLPLKDRHAFAA